MLVPLSIGDFLDRAALVYADRVAVVDEPTVPGSWGQVTYGEREAVVDEPSVAGSWGRITYRELQRRAWGMARALDDLGVGQGERVAIISPNAARFLCSFWGVSGYGRILVPVNYRLNGEEVRYIVEHSGATVVLVDPEYDEAMAAVGGKQHIVLDGSADADLWAPADQPPDGGPWLTDENDTASILRMTTCRPPMPVTA